MKPGKWETWNMEGMGNMGNMRNMGDKGDIQLKKKVERSVFNPSDRFLRCRTMISLVKATAGTNYSNLLFSLSVLGDTGIRNANL